MADGTTIGEVDATTGAIKVEAEDLISPNGEYRAEDRNFASGGQVASLFNGDNNRSGVSDVLSYAFEGDAGAYDIAITAFDENDGVGSIELRVNGVLVETFVLDGNLPSDSVSPNNMVVLTASGVTLSPDDVIEITGIQGGGEWVRIDALDFTPVGPPPPPPEPAPPTGDLDDVNVALDADFVINLDEHFSDINGDALTYSISGPGAAYAQLDGSTLTINASVEGDFGLTVIANDGTFDSAPVAFTFSAAEVPPEPVLIEAEDIIASGFVVENHGVTSQGQVASLLNSGGSSGELAYTFEAGAGTYDLSIIAHDENDGVSTVEVLVDGVLVETFTLDGSFPSGAIADNNRVSLDVTGLNLAPGAEVVVRAQQGGGEWVRIDTLEFTPVGPPPPPPEPAPPTGDLADVNVALDAPFIIDLDEHFSDINGDALTYSISGPGAAYASLDGSTLTINASVEGDFGLTVIANDGTFDSAPVAFTFSAADVPPEPISIEAETIIASGFVVENHGVTSQGQVASLLNSGNSQGELSYTFEGGAGTYDLSVIAHDENDGVGSIDVLVNGEIVQTFTLDGSFPSGAIADNNRVSLDVEALGLNPGDEIQIIAVQGGGEWMRIDTLEFTPVGPPPPPPEPAPPTGDLDDVNVALDAPFIIDLDEHFSDINGDALTYSISGPGAAYASLDGSTLTINASVEGDFGLTVIANDGTFDSAPVAFTFSAADVPPEPISIEAETIIASGFVVENHGATSQGQVASLLNSGNSQGELSYTFEGGASAYDLSIIAHDENDGVSTVEVLVDGVLVETFTLDGSFPSGAIADNNRVSLDVTGLNLAPGAEVVVRAQQGGGEWVRIDTLEFTPVGPPPPPPEPAPPTGDLDDVNVALDAPFIIDLDEHFSDINGDALTYSISGPGAAYASLDGSTLTINASVEGDFGLTVIANDGTFDSAPVAFTFSAADVPPEPISIEAETIIASGFVVENHGATSQGQVASLLNSGNSQGELSYTFEGGASAYDLSIIAHDENDGVSTVEVLVDGVLVETFTLDGDFPSGAIADNNRVSLDVTGLNLAPGAVITIRAQQGQGEWVRIDKLEFTPVGPINEAPVGTPSPAIAATEDVVATFNEADLLANFTDPEGDAMTVDNLSTDVGQLAPIGNGDWTLTAPANFNGQITLTYGVSDGQGNVTPASRTVDVAAVNDAPTTSPVDAGAAYDDAAPVPINLLDGASDAENDVLSAINITVLDDLGASAAFTDNGDGTITIDPTQYAGLAADQSRTLTVSYDVFDGTDATANTATLEIDSAAGINHAPVGTPAPAIAASEDVVTTINEADLLANFTDPDGDAMTVESLATDIGQLTPIGNGDWALTTPAHFNGPVTLTYGVSDGQGNVTPASRTVDVAAVNDAPTGALGDVDVTVDTPLVIDLAAAFSDVESDALTYSISGPGAAYAQLDGATLTINPTVGGAFDITVIANDGTDDSAPVTFTVSATEIPVDTVPSVVLFADELNLTIGARPFETGAGTTTGLSQDGEPALGEASFGVTPAAYQEAGIRYGRAIDEKTGVLHLDIYRPEGSGGDLAIRYSVTNDDGTTSNFTIRLRDDNYGLWTVEGVDTPVRLRDLPADQWHHVTADLTALIGDGATLSSIAVRGDGDGGDTYYLDNVQLTETTAYSEPVHTEIFVSPLWSSAPGAFIRPESAQYDPDTGYVFVSEALPDGQGKVMLLDTDGNIVDPDWLTGLTWPKGLIIENGLVYVATDKDLVVANAATGEVVATYTADAGASLNDVTMAADGSVYVSDLNQAAVWRLKDGVFEIFVSDPTLVSANGIRINDDKLWLATFDQGVLYEIDLETKAISQVLDGVQAFDGVIEIEPGIWLMSSFNGQIRMYNEEDGSLTSIYSNLFNHNAADIGYDPASQTIFVPTFSPQGVFALQLHFPEGAGTPTPVPSDPIEVEAETIIASGFIVEDQGVASEGQVASILNSGGSSGELSYTFSAATSVYDLSVFVHDENDGVSTVEVLVNGAVVKTFTLDASLGSNAVADNNRVSLDVAGLALEAGDEVVIRAQQGGGEWVRVDKLVFTPVGGAPTPAPTPNQAPVGTPAQAVAGVEDMVTTITMAELLSNFTDPDGDPMTVEALSTDTGQLIPLGNGAWALSTPADFNGPVTLTFNVDDGNGGVTPTTRTVDIAPVNDAPAVDVALLSQTVDQNSEYAFTVPTDAFLDVDGDALTLTATLADGSELPAWLTFDGVAFSGTPSRGDVGIIDIKVIATDPSGETAEQTFALTINLINDLPSGASTLSLTIEEDSTDLSLSEAQLLEGFTDPDGDVMSVTGIQVSEGSITLDIASGLWNFVPPENFNGDVTLSWNVIDGNGGVTPAQTTIQITPVNDAPVANIALTNQSIDEDTEFSYLVPADAFSDVDNDALTLTATLTDGSELPIWLTFDGTTFSGTPDQADVGTLDIKVIATDPSGESAEQSFTLTIGAVNDAPTGASTLSLTIEEDSTDLSLSEAQLLEGFIDDDGDIMSVTDVQVSGGTIELDGDTGLWDLAPPADFIGDITLSWNVIDGNGGVTPAQTTIQITPVNDAPVANIALTNQSADEDTEFSFTVPADAFSDVENDAITLTATLTDDSELPAWLTFDGTTFSGTPDQADVGTLNIKVIATDPSGATGEQTFTLSIGAVNDAPTGASSLTINIDEDFFGLSLSENQLLSGFTDPEGDVMSATDLQVSQGFIDFDINTGLWNFFPPSNFNGEVTLSWNVNDGNGGVTPAQTTIQIAPVNDAPVSNVALTNQSANEDAPFSFAVPATAFRDADGDALTLTATLDDDTALPAWLTFDGTSFTGTPVQADVGSLDIKVIATDPSGETATQTFTLTIGATNDAPVSVGDAYSTNEDTALVIPAAGVLVNDTDEDGDALDAVLVSDVSNGALTLNADGSFTYTPNADFNGSDSFTYKANDGTTDGDTVTVDITVDAVNDAPVADAALTNQSADEDAEFSYTVPADAFTDIEGDALTLTATLDDDTELPAWLTFDGTSFTGTPAQSDVGSLEVKVTATDPSGETATQTFTLTIGATNDAPVSVGDAYSTDEDTALVIPAAGVLVNDTDEDGDALDAVLVSDVSNGTLTLNADGSFTYTPNADFNGADSFTYKANDGTTDGDTVTVDITVNAVNDAPVGAATAALVDGVEDVAYIVSEADLLAGFSDVDLDTLSVENLTADNGVDVTDNTDGTFTLTPPANFNGEVALSYDVTDGELTALATQAVTFAAINDAPVAPGELIGPVDENSGSYTISLLANATDADGDVLTAQNITATDDQGQAAAFDISAPGVILFDADQYESLNTGQLRVVTISFDVSDGTTTTPTTKTIIINGQTDTYDEFVLVDDAFEVDYDDDAVAFNLFTNDTFIGTDYVFFIDQPDRGVVTLDSTSGDISFDPSGAFDDLGEGETAEVSVTYGVYNDTGRYEATATFTVNGPAAPAAPAAVSFASANIDANEPSDNPYSLSSQQFNVGPAEVTNMAATGGSRSNGLEGINSLPNSPWDGGDIEFSPTLLEDDLFLS